jgi:uncharacterized protein affecting Mg2+/Co2+ transport
MKEKKTTKSINSVYYTQEWCKTNEFRYAYKYILIDENTAKTELMLQQMWQCNDGSTKWEWIEIFE